MTPVCTPDAARVESAGLTRLIRRTNRQNFEGLRAFALADMEGYWRNLVANLHLSFRAPFRQVMDLSDGVERARWFDGGLLNFTDCLLSPEESNDDDIALIEKPVTRLPFRSRSIKNSYEKRKCLAD